MQAAAAQSVSGSLSGTVVDLSYVGAKGRRLLQLRELNTVPYGARFRPEHADPTRPGFPRRPEGSPVTTLALRLVSLGLQLPGGPFLFSQRVRWKGTLVTMVCGLNSSAPLMRSARWLWNRWCHQRAGTNSGSTTVT